MNMLVFYVVDEHAVDRSGPLNTFEEAETLATDATGPRRIERFYVERGPDGNPCAKCLKVLDGVFAFKVEGLKRLKSLGMTPPAHR